MIRQIYIYCDGGARGNPGEAASAFVVKEGKNIIHKNSFYLGIATNNEAEYTAVQKAMVWLVSDKTFKEADVKFVLDSELVAMQLKGRYKVKSENLKKIYLTVKELENSFSGKVVYESVPREKNKLADSLVNQKLDNQL